MMSDSPTQQSSLGIAPQDMFDSIEKSLLVF